MTQYATMRRMAWRAACGAALVLGNAQAHAGGNLGASVGVRAMDDGYWAPVESQGLIGARVDFAPGRWPLAASAAVQLSAADAEEIGTTVEAAVAEWSVGVTLLPAHGVVRPFGGVGVVVTRVSTERRAGGVTTEHADRTGGFYVEGGLYWRVLRNFDVGGSLRLVGGTDVELGGARGDADAVVLTALVGYGWGGDQHRRRRGSPD